MKLEEVLPALRAGKPVQYHDHPAVFSFEQLAGRYGTLHVFLQSNQWSIVEEPATDEELAAAFEAKAEEVATSNPAIFWRTENMLRLAADMVRKRYVDPGWKVGGGK
jgi:hypothetical protein